MDVNIASELCIFCPLLPTPDPFSVGLLSHLLIFLYAVSFDLVFSPLPIKRLMAEPYCFGYITHVHNYTNPHMNLLRHGSLNMRVIGLKK